jgi:hypothetical protein
MSNCEEESAASADIGFLLSQQVGFIPSLVTELPLSACSLALIGHPLQEAEDLIDITELPLSACDNDLQAYPAGALHSYPFGNMFITFRRRYRQNLGVGSAFTRWTDLK